MKNIKLRVDIVEDTNYSNAGIGKKYRVDAWIFDKKTGRTLEHGCYGTGYNMKEARKAKKNIEDSYRG